MSSREFTLEHTPCARACGANAIQLVAAAADLGGTIHGPLCAPCTFALAKLGERVVTSPLVATVFVYDGDNWAEAMSRCNAGQLVEIDLEMYQYFLEVLPPRSMGATVQVGGLSRRTSFTTGEGGDNSTAFWSAGDDDARRYFMQEVSHVTEAPMQETLPDGARRDWMSIAADLTSDREKIAGILAALEWQSPPPETLPAAYGLALRTAVQEFGIPRVSAIATSSALAPLGLLAVEGNYTNGRVRIYLADRGSVLTPLCADHYPKADETAGQEAA